MTFPELARQRVEANPERWLEPYEKARADGDWLAPEALLDRINGRPAQASASQHFEEIEAGDVIEIRRLLLEAITVERSDELSRESYRRRRLEARLPSAPNPIDVRGPLLRP